MAKEWYKKIGFRANPLSYEPKFGDKLFGYDALLDEVFYRIEAGNMIFLEGIIGKTATLLKIIEKYKGQGRVAYVNCERVGEEPDIKKLLNEGRYYSKTRVSSVPKDMIILLDNVSHLSKMNAEKIKYYFDHGNILSLVMTSTDYANVELPMSIKHRIGKRVYKLKSLTQDEAVDLVLDRLNFNDMISPEQVYSIASRSKNIRELFDNCSKVLAMTLERGIETVDDSIIAQISAVSAR
jgi:hypothetical protein